MAARPFVEVQIRCEGLGGVGACTGSNSRCTVWAEQLHPPPHLFTPHLHLTNGCAAICYEWEREEGVIAPISACSRLLASAAQPPRSERMWTACCQKEVSLPCLHLYVPACCFCTLASYMAPSP